MSGEQAEERKAREGRMDKEALRKKLEAIKPYSIVTFQGMQSATYTIKMCRCGLNMGPGDEQCGRCNQLELLSECSRLASRVEELEKLAIALRDHMNSLWRLGINHAQFCKWHNGYPCDCILHGKLSDEHGRLDFDASTLAGAHAEEKSK
jgi:hypothetical protein